MNGIEEIRRLAASAGHCTACKRAISRKIYVKYADAEDSRAEKKKDLFIPLAGHELLAALKNRDELLFRRQGNMNLEIGGELPARTSRFPPTPQHRLSRAPAAARSCLSALFPWAASLESLGESQRRFPICGFSACPAPIPISPLQSRRGNWGVPLSGGGTSTGCAGGGLPTPIPAPQQCQRPT